MKNNQIQFVSFVLNETERRFTKQQLEIHKITYGYLRIKPPNK